jgi:hypothetical protein
MTEMAVLTNIATGIIMANHSSAVIGRTPLYLPIRVDNFYYAIELTTALPASRRFLGKFCCFDVRGVSCSRCAGQQEHERVFQ